MSQGYQPQPQPQQQQYQQQQWQQQFQGPQTVLITGASTGIGLQYAKVFAERGYHVLMVADDSTHLTEARQEILRTQPQAQLTPIVRDLSLPGAAQQLYNECKQRSLNVKFLVNNAAITTIGKFLESDAERQAKMIQLYILSTVVLTHNFAMDMIRQGGGHILIMSSVHANWPAPCMAVYGACCTFLKNFSLAIQYELQKTGVHVTCIAPGPVKDTLFAQRGGAVTHSMLPRAYRGWLPQLQAEQVARRGYNAAIMNKNYYTPGLTNWFLTKLSTVLPESVMVRVAYFLNTC